MFGAPAEKSFPYFATLFVTWESQVLEALQVTRHLQRFCYFAGSARQG